MKFKLLIPFYLVILCFFACVSAKSQTDSKLTFEILTNAQCGMCKDRIEGELNFVKGIVFAELNVASKVLTVKYKSSKISADDIRTKVSEIGYNADDIKADPEAQRALPACCQPGGH
jgi:mercuric ion binding protein